MNSIAEYIIDRTGLFAWTEDDPLLQGYNKDFVMYVIETCAALGAKTGMA